MDSVKLVEQSDYANDTMIVHNVVFLPNDSVANASDQIQGAEAQSFPDTQGYTLSLRQAISGVRGSLQPNG